MRCAFELEGENLYSIKWFQVIRNIVVECPTQLTVDNWICSMTNISEIYERTQQGNKNILTIMMRTIVMIVMSIIVKLIRKK